MKPICIKDSEKSPAVFMDLDSGRLIITGISVMANPRSTYLRLIDVIKQYATQPAKKSNISIMLQQTNAHSMLFLMEVLRLMISTKSRENIHIDWLYDSKDAELSEEIDIFQDILDVEINKVAYVKMAWSSSSDAEKIIGAINPNYE